MNLFKRNVKVQLTHRPPLILQVKTFGIWIFVLCKSAYKLASATQCNDCWSMTVGREDQLNLYYAQLAIYEAVNYTNTIVSNLNIPASTTWTTIVTSNLSALQSLAKPRYQSGQSLIRQITDGILRIAETGMNTNLQWLSSDDETPGLQHAIRPNLETVYPRRWNFPLRRVMLNWRVTDRRFQEQNLHVENIKPFSNLYRSDKRTFDRNAG
ncbi:hypothetical protein TCE0_044r16224 [Talaromyces pinophilus]|uniref:Uncharacterized protein n=1 Tax=Talaromyces pinophilus TaxID=128442 RepID=A0A478EBA3_TALPI|nr:hypothetical protein TCE0_044r16224 [Talaromyces pinophilus]